LSSNILIIDGLFFIYRSSTFTKGKYGIVYSFFKNLRYIIEQFNPDKCFFVLEGRPQFRYNLYSGYKSNRINKFAATEKINDLNFKEQTDLIIKLLKYLPIQIIKSEAYEADDTISSICENIKNENIIIISNDTDYIQLLQKNYTNIRLYNPIKKQFIEPPEYHYLLWKILRGDPSDNITGIVSDEEAEKLAKSPNKLLLFLKQEENRSNFNLNRDLITLRKVPDEEIIFFDYTINFDYLKSEFKKMEFKTFLNKKYWNKFIMTFGKLK
jgi:5'-3' exonuclease